MDPRALAALAYDAFDRPPLEAVRFLAHAAPRQAPRTLDVGCGTGRIMASLVDRGWPVVGVEPDDARRERAHARLAGRAAVIPGRFESLDVGDGWELIAAINGPLSYVVDGRARRRALRLVHAALAPGGVLVLDLPNFPWILRNYRSPPPDVRTFEGWTLTRSITHAIDWHDGTFTHRDRFEILRGEQRAEVDEVHVMALLSWPMVAWELEEAGFTDVRTHRSLADLAPGRIDGPRIVVQARR